jgi:tetratricopeptide (TPR) repeat protein
MQFSSGDRLDSYEIVAALGAGGMGRVYRARDLQLGREVAIKVLSEEAARDPTAFRRLVAEARAASALNHPNILTVYGMGQASGHPYIVTELIHGSTLRELLREGPLPAGEAVDLTLQALAGLAKAHAAGLVHRDLKPENLIVSQDGYLKILDFGLAKLMEDVPGRSRELQTLGFSTTAAGFVRGTPLYMSPEQARGEPAGVASDLFSLGVVLYETLTGVHPFRRSSLAETLSAILKDPVPPLEDLGGVSLPEMQGLFEKLLHKEPAARHASAAELDEELRALRERLPSTPYRSRRQGLPRPAATPRSAAGAWPRWRRGQRVAGVLVPLLAVAVAGSLYVRQRLGARAVPAPPGAPAIVAVMAIDNATRDPQLGEADAGRILADAFLQVLYDCEGVQVVSPLRVQSIVSRAGRSYVDTARDPELVRKVCEGSGANTVLSGSLSQVGRTYILSVALTDHATGKLLGSFEARTEAMQDILGSLVMQVAGTIKVTLGTTRGVRVAGGRDVTEVATASFDAYSHFVRGMDLNNVGDWSAAMQELNQAIAIDPTMGIAWSELGCSYSFSGDEAKAEAAMRRALELRSHMSRKERLWVEATSAWLTGNGEFYRQRMQEYIDAYPDDRQGYFYIGLGWQWLDKDCRKALESYDKAYALTPEYYPITKGLVDCHLEMGERERALASLRRYLKLVRSGLGHQHATWRLEELSGRS